MRQRSSEGKYHANIIKANMQLNAMNALHMARYADSVGGQIISTHCVIKEFYWICSYKKYLITVNYCIRTNIGGYNIWRFVEIMDLARY